MKLDPELKVTQSLARRDRVRAELVARIPSWYSPWAHLALTSVVGLGLMAGAIAMVHAPSALELLAIPLILTYLNFNEWHIHKYLLHHRTWPLQQLFDRHTPEHHVVFVRDDMAIREWREFRLVLIPSWGIVAIFCISLPTVTAALWYLISPNVALFWVAVSMAYVVSYEWLHLSYHLPAGNPIGESRFIRALRRSHAMHHTPELMQKWNFNVTLPLADWVWGTIHPGTFAPVTSSSSGERSAGRAA